jgi:hypothetical protein
LTYSIPVIPERGILSIIFLRRPDRRKIRFFSVNMIQEEIFASSKAPIRAKAIAFSSWYLRGTAGKTMTGGSPACPRLTSAFLIFFGKLSGAMSISVMKDPVRFGFKVP